MKTKFEHFKKDLKKYEKKYDRIAKRADNKASAIYEERRRRIDRENKRFNKKHPNFGKIVVAAMLLTVAFPFGIAYLIASRKEN